ncbi:hypothetical protein NDU88_007178 [Pleurodeles waltl]|uniref:Uncharacterized protein n=1 Tax=Pleurodeles waltl TaxID=8319 RepID=A0AAV7VRF0_PLEWA|nr:hypothetical protein NDU88_007178 [Pleurodeles waltl]
MERRRSQDGTRGEIAGPKAAVPGPGVVVVARARGPAPRVRLGPVCGGPPERDRKRRGGREKPSRPPDQPAGAGACSGSPRTSGEPGEWRAGIEEDRLSLGRLAGLGPPWSSGGPGDHKSLALGPVTPRQAPRVFPCGCTTHKRRWVTQGTKMRPTYSADQR